MIRLVKHAAIHAKDIVSCTLMKFDDIIFIHKQVACNFHPSILLFDLAEYVSIRHNLFVSSLTRTCLITFHHIMHAFFSLELLIAETKIT